VLFLDIVLFFVGLVALLWGADKLVDNAKYIANKFGVHPIIIGLTILSIGTSIPEIATSIISFTTGHADVAMGNIIGSELVQITLILALVALFRPLKGDRKQVIFYGISMLVAIGAALFVISDGYTTWFEGLALITLYVIFIMYVFHRDHSQFEKEGKVTAKVTKKTSNIVLMIIFGLVLTIVGSKLLLNSTVNMANYFGISEFIISVFIVGLGTSIPELVVSAIAAYKGQSAMSVGNLLGSNITDPTLSFGMGMIFAGKTAVNPAATSSIIFLLVVCLLVVSLFAWRRKFGRASAIFAILLYITSFFFI